MIMNNIKGLSDKKRAEIAAVTVDGNKMVSLNEAASLAQQLDALIDDSNGDIISVSIDSGRSLIHMRPLAFLIEFIDFKIETRDSVDYPYEFTRNIGGVIFYAIMSAAEVVDLTTSIPDQFDYISSKVQLDKEGR